MMEGGTATTHPTAVRIRDRAGSVLVEGPTRALTAAVNPGVCRERPPRSPTWWSRTIPESVAEAVRHHDYETFLFEGQFEGQWKALSLEDSGCRNKGAG